jgi:hypothetical protein
MKIKFLALASAFIALSGASAFADHPAYLHALSDLRSARAYLYDGPHGGRIDAAINQINTAIHQIKDAAIDDGRGYDWAPPIDTGLGGGRFRRALELLNSAHDDVYQEEDNGWARGLRNRAGHNIDLARDEVRWVVHHQ